MTTSNRVPTTVARIGGRHEIAAEQDGPRTEMRAAGLDMARADRQLTNPRTLQRLRRHHKEQTRMTSPFTAHRTTRARRVTRQPASGATK